MIGDLTSIPDIIFGLGDNGYILAIIAMQNILQK
jgi:hypothetical protein